MIAGLGTLAVLVLFGCGLVFASAACSQRLDVPAGSLTVTVTCFRPEPTYLDSVWQQVASEGVQQR